MALALLFDTPAQECGTKNGPEARPGAMGGVLEVALGPRWIKGVGHWGRENDPEQGPGAFRARGSIFGPKLPGMAAPRADSTVLSWDK